MKINVKSSSPPSPFLAPPHFPTRPARTRCNGENRLGTVRYRTNEGLQEKLHIIIITYDKCELIFFCTKIV